MSGVVRTDMVSVTVHGPAGVLDLVVPAGATVAALVREYTASADPEPPLVLRDRAGRPFPSDLTIAAAGVRSGSVLVMTPAAAPLPEAGVRRSVRQQPERGFARLPGLVVGVAALFGVLAAVVATGADDVARNATATALAVAALLALAPVGVHVEQRVRVAPLLAGSAAFVLAHEQGATNLPVAVGIAALVAAAAAGAARVVVGPNEALSTWIVAGSAWFLLVLVVQAGGGDPQVTWSLALVAAWAAALLVPRWAVGVPDRMLVDLELLAVTAWSAREESRAPSTPVGAASVAELLARGGRIVDAGAVAAAATVAVAAPQLTMTTVGVDRLGAGVLLAVLGVALLLQSRSLRHRMARLMLRVAAALALLCASLPHLGMLPAWSAPWLVALAGLAAAGATAAGVAIGRGWRSAWWARRAEISEWVVAVLLIAAAVVATGWFRAVWEFQA